MSKSKRKEIRVAKAKSSIASVIDDGQEVDGKIKDLVYQDKENKQRIIEEAQKQFEKGEKSLRLLGDKSAALVSSKERFQIKTTRKSFLEVQKAIRNGMALGVVDQAVVATINPEDLEKVKKKLGSAFNNIVNVRTEYIVSPDGVRKLEDNASISPQSRELLKALKDCTDVSTTLSVSFKSLK